MVSHLIDAMVVIMLVAATGYMVLVNQRLKLLRSSQSDMAKVLEGFDRIIADAQRTIAELRRNADEVAATLGADIGRGQALAPELRMLSLAATRAGDRLDGLLRQSRELRSERSGGEPATRPVQPASGRAGTADLVFATSPSLCTTTDRQQAEPEPLRAQRRPENRIFTAQDAPRTRPWSPANPPAGADPTSEETARSISELMKRLGNAGGESVSPEPA